MTRIFGFLAATGFCCACAPKANATPSAVIKGMSVLFMNCLLCSSPIGSRCATLGSRRCRETTAARFAPRCGRRAARSPGGSFQLHGHLVDLPGEFERRRIGGVDRGTAVLADILSLVERVLESGRVLDTPRADALAVGEQRDRAAFAHATTVVAEVESKRDFPRLHDFVRHDTETLAVDVVMHADQLAVLDIEAPAGGNSALREDHALRAAGWNLHFRGDRERLVLQIRRRAFGKRDE